MKEAQKRKQSGRRMIIEEVEGEDKDGDEDVPEEIIVEKPDDDKRTPPLVNGHAENATGAMSHHAKLSEQEPTTKAADLSPGSLPVVCVCVCVCEGG